MTPTLPAELAGVCSVLYAAPGSESTLEAEARAYLRALDALPALLYADLHGTKHPDKFVLVEMYRDGRSPGADPGAGWRSHAARWLREDSRSEAIRPLLSCAAQLRRPVTAAQSVHPHAHRIGAVPGRSPCGACVRVFADPARLGELLQLLARQGEIVAAREPGFLFGDFHALDTPGELLVVEYYDDRASLSEHHTLPHTFEFAARKAEAGYEIAKHQAFTLRPLASVGPCARLFEEPATVASADGTARR
jgi:quinol monooxygenase YgiN